MGDTGGVLPGSVMSTDNPALFNGEREGSPEAAISIAAAVADAADAWGGARSEEESGMAAI